MQPDTALNEVAVMTTSCKTCNGTSLWTPPASTGGKNVTGTSETLQYFYLSHAFDVEVKGTYYKLPACIEHDPNPAVCLLNFDVFGISSAKPSIQTNGDGYMGLGLGNSIASNSDNRSILSQLKQHGLIDKKIFSVYTQLFNQTDTPSQIRFGGSNSNLFNNSLHYITTLKDDSWKINLA